MRVRPLLAVVGFSAWLAGCGHGARARATAEALRPVSPASARFDRSAGLSDGATYRLENHATLEFHPEGRPVERLEQVDRAVVDAVPSWDPGLGRRLVLTVQDLRTGAGASRDEAESRQAIAGAAGRHLALLSGMDCRSKQVVGIDLAAPGGDAARALEQLLVPLLPCLPDGRVRPGSAFTDPIKLARGSEDGRTESSFDVAWRLKGRERGGAAPTFRLEGSGPARLRETAARHGQELRIDLSGTATGVMRVAEAGGRLVELVLSVVTEGSVSLVDPVTGDAREFPVRGEQVYRAVEVQRWAASEASVPSADEEAAFALGEGMLLLRAERWDEAVERLERAAAAGLPFREELLTRVALGTALFMQGRAREALPHLERAVEMAPDHPLAGRLREAAASLAQAGGGTGPGAVPLDPEGVVRAFLRSCLAGDGPERARFFSRRIPEALVRTRVAPLWEMGDGLDDGADRAGAAALVDASLKVRVLAETRGTARVEVTGEASSPRPLSLVFYLVKEDDQWAILSTEGEAGALILSALLERADDAGDEELGTLLRLAEENLGTVGQDSRYDGLDVLSWGAVAPRDRARFARGLLELAVAPGAASRALDALERDDPRGVPARFLRALADLGAGRFGEARAALQALHGEGVPLASVEFQLARAAERAGSPAEATRLLEGLRARDGESWHVLHALGDAYGSGGDGPRAIEAYRKALEADSTRSITRNNLAWQYARSGRDLDEGIALASSALSQEPDNPAFLDTLAELLYRQGRRKEALRIIEQALALDPEAPHLQEQRRRFRKRQ